MVELGGRTVTYGYDNAYRLTGETITGATPSGALGYGYDHTGNRQSRTSTVAGIPAVPSSTYDANDRLAGNTYDNNGNTLTANSVTYTYDFLNRLATATGGIALTYDGDNNRVAETAAGTTTQYLIDDNNPTGLPQVVEELVGGVVQRQYTYGHALLSANQASGVRFYGMDAQHTVRFLTDPSGTVTDQYTYDAFGTLLASSGTTPNSYRFAGEHLDASLGLYYLRARYYNPSVGRFWNRDSAELNPDDPRELNRYVYTADNPVNRSDPTGYLMVEDITIAKKTNIQAVAGAAIAATALVCILTRTTSELAAAMIIATQGGEREPINPCETGIRKETCETRFPALRKCSDLPQRYQFLDKQTALEELKTLLGDYSLKFYDRKGKPSYDAPCPNGRHYSTYGQLIGRGLSIGECPCCAYKSNGQPYSTKRCAILR